MMSVLHLNFAAFAKIVLVLGAVFHVIVLLETWITDELDLIEIPIFSSYHSIRPEQSVMESQY